MSRSLNKALLIGNLGADPEVRATSDGTRVAEFSIATNRTWTDRSGAKQERTEWHRIVAWAKLAEIAERYLRRGDSVCVEGEIQYRSYEDREGVTRYITEIRAREMIMLGGKNGGTPGDASSAPHRGLALVGAEQAPAEGSPSEAFEEPDDDLPF